MHHHLDAGVVGACLGDLGGVEPLVNRAEAVPQNHAGIGKRGLGVAAEFLARVPHRHLLERDPHCLGCVAAKVLIGEEQHPLAALECPFQHRAGVGGGAHDSAVAAAERLQSCRRVHVGDRDDRELPAGVVGGIRRTRWVEPVDLRQVFPGGLNRVLVCHICHRAAGCKVGQDHALVLASQDVCRFGHEVHAAEHDRLGVGLGQRGVGELEGVTHEVGVRHDLIALVVVAQHHHAVAELRLGRLDPSVQFLVRHRLIERG